MKKIIYIILLVSYISFGQSKLVGDALYTEAQKIYLQDRYDATSGKYISNTTEFQGDWNRIKSNATSFYADMEDDLDSGAWDNFYSDDSNLTEITNSTDKSNAEPIPINGVNGYIHAASIDVVFTSTDKHEKAMKVFKAILNRANDDKLDAGNGLTKTNTTFGTTNRFDKAYSGDSNPWFISAAKMSIYIESYALIQPYIKTDSYYLANYERVEQWFEDWADFFKSIANNRLKNALGNSWETGNYGRSTTLAYQEPLGGQGSTYWIADGSSFNTITWKQSSGFNNRVIDLCKMPFIYGIYFNDSTYKDFGFNFFKAWLIVSIFPDGTSMEWYKSSDVNPQLGFGYMPVIFGGIVSMAQAWAVGVQNGLIGITDKGKFYDFTTTEGAEDTDLSYPGTHTGGTEKGIYSVIMNWAKYYQTSAKGGYKTIRKSELLVDYDGSSRVAIDVTPAVANTYYKTGELAKFVQLDPTEGYDTKVRGGTVGQEGNGAWGSDWSVGGWGSFIGRTGSYAELPDIFTDVEPGSSSGFNRNLLLMLMNQQ